MSHTFHQPEILPCAEASHLERASIIDDKDRFHSSITMNPSLTTITPSSGSAADLAELRMLLMQQQYQPQQLPARNNSLMFWDQLDDLDQRQEHRRLSSMSHFRGFKSPAASTKSLLASHLDHPASAPLVPGMMSKVQNDALARMSLTTSSSHLTSKRLKRNSLLGGFPMPPLMNFESSSPQVYNKRNSLLDFGVAMPKDPKLFGKPSAIDLFQRSQQQRLTTGSKGSFPLPKLRPARKTSTKPYSLRSYQSIWYSSHDKEVNREIFARRLHQGKISFAEERK
jgi:hypothetical protein